MPEVHSSAILNGDVSLADDVTIGPGCVITGPSSIGAGTRLIGNVYVEGPVTIGQSNTVYPYACLGFAPQDLKWPVGKSGAGLIIGDRNVFRESVTIHRATSDDTPTTIGSDNYFMATSHAGHDSTIGSNCVFANSTLIAGHVEIQNRVITGGNTAIHQFVRLGEGAMMSGGMCMGLDLPPWFMLTGTNTCGTVNTVGLRRSGLDKESINNVRWVHRIVYREARSLKGALEKIASRAGEPMIDAYIDFLESTKRGICHGVTRSIRSTSEIETMSEVSESAPY